MGSIEHTAKAKFARFLSHLCMDMHMDGSMWKVPMKSIQVPRQHENHSIHPFCYKDKIYHLLYEFFPSDETSTMTISNRVTLRES